MNLEHQTNTLVASLFRKQRGKLIATMTNFMGVQNLGAIEDIIQETFFTALKSWPTHPPENPEAWLITVAKNKAINYLKKQGRQKSYSLEEKELDGLRQEEDISQFFLADEISNNQLRLLFACSKLEISERNRVMLLLRLVCGFDGAQIARALLLKRDTVFKTLQRTIKVLQREQFSLKPPSLSASGKHLETVHTILYLLFNEGFLRVTDTKELGMKFCEEAMYLTQLLLEHKIANTHTLALKALFCFNAARIESRLSQGRMVILLKDQDRSKWNQELIALGFKNLRLSNTGTDLSRFHLEAGIASLHCMAKSFEETDWEKILWYYDKLVELTQSPVICLNQVIAFYHCYGPKATTKRMEALHKQKAMENYYLFHAFNGELHVQLQEYPEAIISFQKALRMTSLESEQHFLREKIKTISF